MNGILLLLILTFSVIIVGTLSLAFKDLIKKLSYPVTLVSSAMVCGLIFIHIFPEIFEQGGHQVGLAILVGLFLQMTLERLTGGFEHGHQHTSQSKGAVIGIMLGLCLHAFIEAMPLLVIGDTNQTEQVLSNIHIHDHSGHNHHDHDHGQEHNHEIHQHQHTDQCNHNHHEELSDNKDIKLNEVQFDSNLKTKFFWAIINHNIPITLVLSTLFISFGFSFKKSLSLIVLFALAAPFGALLGIYLLNIDGMLQYSSYLMGISTGMLLHIITHILTEHSHEHKKSNLITQIGSFLLGLVLVYLIFGV